MNNTIDHTIINISVNNINDSSKSIYDIASLNNTYLDLIVYAKNNLSLEVVEVMDIDQVILQLTGVSLNQKIVNLTYNSTENDNYNQIMGGLQKVICERTKNIEDGLKENKIKITEEILNVSLKKKESPTAATSM